MIKELFKLIKLLFSPVGEEKIAFPVIEMEHFPFKGYSFMMWCGHIIKRKEYEVSLSGRVITHELIHFRQAQCYGSWIKYYLQYLWQWIKRINPFASVSAYTVMPFEMEAVGNEHNPNYFPTKKSWKIYDIPNPRREYRLTQPYWKEYLQTLRINNN